MEFAANLVRVTDERDCTRYSLPTPAPKPGETYTADRDGIETSLGSCGDSRYIGVRWLDHNNIRYRETIQVEICDRDKPRTLRIFVNGRLVHCATAPLP